MGLGCGGLVERPFTEVVAMPARVWILCGLMVAGIPAFVRAAEGLPASGEVEFFEKKVRPVLVARCYKCHSAEGKVKGQLRLDTRAGWMKGGETGPAFIAGDPDHSLAIQAIRHAKQDLEMPPDSKLPEAEVAILVEWVKRGAPDPRTGPAPAIAAARPTGNTAKARSHWSYQPIRAAAAPAVKDATWPKGEIDRFILAGLEAKGLKPAADASPEALVRRVYFDLIGLPPTPEEMDAYLADSSANRFEKLVDKLLASPRFGERWGRHWLDVARFGESLTLRGFIIKDAWRYRDYVIESFNLDRPFDQFVREQVSGDLMPSFSADERRRGLIATEFLTIGNSNLEEQDKKQLDMDVVDEQLDTIGKAFLGQTIGCARCHDHKFDPIPTKDYYALAGIMRGGQMLEHSNVSTWINMPLPIDPAKDEALKKHEERIAELTAKVKEAKAQLAKSKKKGQGGAENASIPIKDLGGFVVDDTQAKRVGTWRESVARMKYFVGEGYLTEEGQPGGAMRTLTFILPDAAETGKYEVRLAYTAAPARGTHVSVTVFGADGEKNILVNMREAPPIDDLFISLGQFNFEKNGQSFVILSNQDAGGNLVGDAVQFIRVDQLEKVAAATKAEPGVKAAPLTAVETSAAAMKKMEAELKKLTEEGPKRETVQALRERTGEGMGDIRIHVRGSPHTLGEVAPRGFLSVVPVKNPPAVPEKQSGRLELGLWLASRDNPLPARLTANRVWHWLFGAGIVRTTDNFGTTGELPSHPELLDYLATRLVSERWSIKSLIRQVVLSRTYQMAVTGEGGAQVDPENRLVWKQNRRRLDAECLRDAMLAMSGQLKIEYTPGQTFKAGLASDFSYKVADNRRSVYLPAFRNSIPEIFEAFDFADPSVGTGRRNVSTVAPQALFMLNHPWVAEQAGHAADRLLADSSGLDDAARLRRVYRLAVGREPTGGEQRIALEFIGKEGKREAWMQVIQAVFGSVDFRYLD